MDWCFQKWFQRAQTDIFSHNFFEDFRVCWNFFFFLTWAKKVLGWCSQNWLLRVHRKILGTNMRTNIISHFFELARNIFDWCCLNCFLCVHRNICGWFFDPKSIHVYSELANELRKNSTYWGNDFLFLIYIRMENSEDR